jgi:hypothetical protein
MLGMVTNSAKLFIEGKLFKDSRRAMRQLALGAGAGALAMILVGLVAPLWLAAMAGGAVGGVLQPIRFKDLKYA